MEKIMEKNVAFFSLFENAFLTLGKHFDEAQTIQLFTEIMENGLKNAYGSDFNKGDMREFARIVGERDRKVGLKVDFDFLNDHEFTYTFHDYPFPNLKNRIDHQKLDNTFLNFKINYLLGNNWKYQTLKHHFLNDDVTQFLITKSSV